MHAEPGGGPDAVVAISGPFTVATVEQWSRVFTGAVASHPARLVVDLTACSDLDSSAVVTLLRTHRQLARSGARLLLRRPTPAVMRMLYVARVDHVLEVEHG